MCMHTGVKVHRHLFPLRVCTYNNTCMQRCVCVCLHCTFAAFEVTQLCVSPQWSIWKAVRETNDCRYIDCCSLPPPPALLPQWPVLYFSFPPPFRVTSFLFFSSISVLTFPFPICSTNVSPLDLFLSPFL